MHPSPLLVVLVPLLLLLERCQLARSFLLEGSATSYAQFRKWNAGLNGTLEFEFKTEQGNGLLLYTDDGGTYDFFEVKLVESALRLRYNLGGGAQIVTVGHDLGDGHWHKVQITRCNENTTLTVDGVGAISTSRGKEFEFGKLAGNSDVYVGGMPSWYNSKLTLLALPSVIFEPRFNGYIRNLVYADGENTVPRRQEMKSRDVKVCCRASRSSRSIVALSPVDSPVFPIPFARARESLREPSELTDPPIDDKRFRYLRL